MRLVGTKLLQILLSILDDLQMQVQEREASVVSKKMPAVLFLGRGLSIEHEGPGKPEPNKSSMLFTSAFFYIWKFRKEAHLLSSRGGNVQ